MKIGIYIPGAVDQFNAETGLKMVRLLETLGLECYYPDGLTDCGMEFFMQGDRETARLLGEKMMELYEDCNYIVSCGSASVTYMKCNFHCLFHNTTFHNNYRQFVDKLYDVCDFLINEMHYIPNHVSFPHRVAFMDHCTTSRDYVSSTYPERKGLTEEPRQLLKAVEGIELVEMSENDMCCGFGGLFANNFTPISDNLAKRKVERAIAAGAEYIVSTETSCMLHLRSYAEKTAMNIKFAHVLDVICDL